MELNINQVQACGIINRILAHGLPFAVPSGEKDMELRFAWDDWGGEITHGYAVTRLAEVDKNYSAFRMMSDVNVRWQLTPEEWNRMNVEEERRYTDLPEGDFRPAVIGFYSANPQKFKKHEFFIGLRMEHEQVTGVIAYWENRFDDFLRISTDHLDRSVSNIFPDIAECFPGCLLDAFDEFMGQVSEILARHQV